MPKSVDPIKMADMDPNFQKQITERQMEAQKEEEKRKTGDQVPWYKPVGWGGNPFDYSAMEPPFNRDQANADFEKAVKDTKAPGRSGDLVATTTMIDYLSVMERAFKARHTYTFARAVAQQTARKKGHGTAGKGLFSQGILKYVQGILKQTGG
jgi:hypothetical protein